MKLDVKLTPEPCSALLERIRVMRTALRYERDQRGDARCHLDLLLIFAAAGIPVAVRKLPPWSEMERQCREFFVYSQKPGPPQPVRPDAITDPAHWDDDLAEHAEDWHWLRDEEYFLKRAITSLYNRFQRGRRLTYKVYDRVYMVLPEKLHADTRLPPEPEFLGRAKSPCAGCPAFWESHQSCDSDKDCDVHVWGQECPARVPG